MSFLIASGHVEVEAKTDKAMSAITGLVGALGAVGPVAGVMAASMAAAGAGVAAFGVAAGKQIADLKKASDAQGKYQAAVDKSGKSSQEAVKAELAYQQTIAKMPRATREAAAALSALKDEYSDWSDALADDTMPVFTHSFQLFQALLPKTTGLVKGTSAELDRLVTLIAGGVASPGFDRFMADLTDFSRSTLHSAISGLVDLSQAVGGFAAGGGFDEFVDTAREAGPLLGSTLANLAELALNLTSAGGELGITLLTVANALAEMANAIPPETLGTMVQLYSALKLVSLGVAGVNAVVTSSAVARMGAYFTLMRTAGVGTTLRATAASMTAVQKAGIGLGVLAVAAIGIDKLADKARGAPPDVDRLATSLKNLAQTGRFTGELQKTFGDLDGLVAKVKMLHTEAEKANNTAFGFRIPGLDDAADWISSKINDMSKGSESLSALKDDFKSLDQAMSGMVSSGYAKQAAQDFDVMRTALLAEGHSMKEINSLFPQYRESVASFKTEQQLAAQGMGLFGQQAIETKAKLDAQKMSADGLRQSIQALNDVNRQGLGGMIAFEQAVDAAAKAAKDNANSLSMSHGQLDLNSEKAQAAATALNDLAQKTDEAAASARESGQSWETVNGIYTRGRDKLIQSAQAMGLTKTEARALADQILKTPDKTAKLKGDIDDLEAKIRAAKDRLSKVPDSRKAKVLASIADLEAKLRQARNDLANIDGQTATVRIMTQYFTAKSPAQLAAAHGRASGGPVPHYAAGGDVQHFPAGGYIDGPGTGTSDSILALMGSGAMARVSNTEYVMRSAAVQKYGVGFMDAVNSGRLRPPGFAKGGKLSAKQKAALEAEKQRQKEGRSALTSDVTLSTAGKLAGYKNDEMVHNLGMPDSVSSLVSSISTYLSNIKKAFSGKTEAALVSQMTKSGKALLDNEKKLEAVNKRLDSAKDKLEDLKGKFDQLKTSVSSSLVSFANITKIGKYGTSPETLIKQLQSDTSRTTEFASMLEQLKSKGLNAQSISEIAQAGVAGGGMATAQSLLNATPEQIAEINALEEQLKKSADKAGTVTADAMYGAGLKAAEGIVKGLEAQQDKIEAAMMKIAKSMEAAIRKALGIKSPSKLMEPIGDYAFQGVEQGWVKRAATGSTLLSGNAAGLRVRPALIAGGVGAQAPGGPSVVVNLAPTFKTMTAPTAAERKAFAVAMARDINDALLDYQKGRRR